MALLKRVRVLAAKIEVTSGTAETLSASDAVFNAWDVMIQPDIEMIAREGQGSFGHLPQVPGGYKGKATFKIDLNWDGTATEPAWAEAFLPSCGFVKSGQVYTPRSEAPGSNVKTLTIGCYVNGLFKSICGAAGTAKLVCPTGRMAYLECEYTGVWVAPTDVAIISPTYPTASALRYANSTTTWNSVALCLENITVDFGNEITMRECGAANGYEAALITNRAIKIAANPETKLVAGQDRYGALIGMTEGIFTFDIDGPTTSKITVAAPKAQIIKNQEGDRNKMVIDDLEFQCNQNGSTVDTEMTITFTAAV